MKTYRSPHTPETAHRSVIVQRLKRMHKAADEIRCDPLIRDADLDVFMDDILDAVDVVLARIPTVSRLEEPVAA